MKNDLIQFDDAQQTMSSLEIAEVTGKQHKHVMEAIRKMEPAWAKIAGSNFRLGSYSDANGQQRPCYELTKPECLYVATKFNDEARAKLILRWKELETERIQPKQLSAVEMFALQAQINLQNEQRISNIEQSLATLIEERNENTQLLMSAEVSNESLPEETESVKIRKLVNVYVKATGLKYEDVWNQIYETLEYRYGHRVKRMDRIASDKSWLDVAIRHNLGQKMFNVISDMVKTVQNKN